MIDGELQLLISRLKIVARIADSEIDFLIFLCDPLESHPHDSDVKALLCMIVIINEQRTARDWLSKMAWQCRCYFRFHAGLAQILDFIEIVRGAKFSFNFHDEEGTVHKAIILNPDEITSAPVSYSFEGDITL